MGFLQNSFVRYFDRTYQQIKAQIITDLAILAPEITDNNESNPFIKAIGIWSGIAEMLGYYIDNAAREAFLDSCRRYESAVKIARLLDYKILGCTAASVDVTFTLSATYGSAVTIPAGTVVKNADNILFTTTAAGVIPIGQTSVIVSAVQSTLITNKALGVSSGAANQTYIIATNVVNDSPIIRISSVAWTPVSTFAYSLPTDQHYLITVDENKNVIVKFGDGQSGLIPTTGLTIFCDYSETEQALGNVDANTLTTIVSTLTLPGGLTATCTNASRASGGGGVEDIQSLKKRIPLYLSTLRRAVTGQDYIDVAEQAAGVAKAGYTFACGKTVDVYIVPTGGGIASGILIAAVLNWFEDKRMITTKVRVFTAGEVNVLLGFDLYVLPQYTAATVVTNVNANLVNFLSYANQKIGGAVQLADVYEIIERTEGVNYSKINQMTSRPYARPLDSVSPQLNWSRFTQITSTGTNKFKVTMTSPTQFQLTKNTAFVGIFTVGIAVNLPEIIFTINAGTYVFGNQWEFLTYDYYGSLVLQEPSLPIALSGDITINSIGGL